MGEESSMVILESREDSSSDRIINTVEEEQDSDEEISPNTHNRLKVLASKRYIGKDIALSKIEHGKNTPASSSGLLSKRGKEANYKQLTD